MTAAQRALIAGALLAVTAAGTSLQARFNASLLDEVGNVAEVSLVNFVGAFLVVSLVVLLRQDLRRAWARTIRALRSGGLRPWEVLGGLGGAYFVAVQGYGAQVIGVAAFTVAVVAGQTVSAIALDRVGLGPAGRVPVTGRRVVGAVLAIVAVLLPAATRLNSASVGLVVAGVIVLSVTAGLISSMQGALNGRVGAYSGQPIVGAWGNFTLGAVVLGVLVAASVALSPADWGGLPWDQPWLLLAGTLGLAYVATAAWAVRIMGILLTSLISVVGLLVGAVAVDLIAPTGGAIVDPLLLAGVVLSAVGVVLAAWRTRRD